VRDDIRELVDRLTEAVERHKAKNREYVKVIEEQEARLKAEVAANRAKDLELNAMRALVGRL
jgi:hypothetical protein